jgi:hypothetical protein
MPEDTTTTATETTATSEGASLLATSAGETTTTTSEAAPLIGHDGSFAEGWLDRLPAELSDAKATLGKYRNVNDVFKSHFHLQQTLGRKANAVVLPNEKSTPEEVAEFRKAMGIPESADQYDLSVEVEGVPEAGKWTADMLKPFAEIAHKHNVPPSAMKDIVSQIAQVEQNRLEAATGMLEERLKEGETLLKKEYGANYGRNIDRATRAATSLGLDVNSPGLSDPQVVKALVRVADLLSEDKLINADVAPSLQLASTKAKDIQTNPANPMYARYQEGDPEVVGYVRDLLKSGR